MKVFHHNDNDGKCAAAMIYLQHNYLTKNDFISCNYNDMAPSANLIEENEAVYIVDYSFTKETFNILKEINEKSKNVVWLDHHLSSLEIDMGWLERNLYHSEICMSRSGARIAYDYLIKKTSLDSPYIEQIVTLVDDYDRWVHDYPESMWFNIGSELVPNNPMDDIWYSDPEDLIEKGRLIKTYNDRKNTRLTKSNAYPIYINGKKCIVLNTPDASSQAFGNYYDRYKFAIRYAFNGTNYNYSIYSSLPDINCAEIAKHFNPKGGGHKTAAGFVSDVLLFKSGETFNI